MLMFKKDKKSRKTLAAQCQLSSLENYEGQFRALAGKKGNLARRALPSDFA